MNGGEEFARYLSSVSLDLFSSIFLGTPTVRDSFIRCALNAFRFSCDFCFGEICFIGVALFLQSRYVGACMFIAACKYSMCIGISYGFNASKTCTFSTTNGRIVIFYSFEYCHLGSMAFNWTLKLDSKVDLVQKFSIQILIKMHRPQITPLQNRSFLKMHHIGLCSKVLSVDFINNCWQVGPKLPYDCGKPFSGWYDKLLLPFMHRLFRTVHTIEMAIYDLGRKSQHMDGLFSSLSPSKPYIYHLLESYSRLKAIKPTSTSVCVISPAGLHISIGI